jgi:hypothetical protein
MHSKKVLYILVAVSLFAVSSTPVYFRKDEKDCYRSRLEEIHDKIPSNEEKTVADKVVDTGTFDF